jgi:hypothetical protein
VEDPLPLPIIRQYNMLTVFNNRNTKKRVAVIVCLFLGITLIIFPHLALDEGKPGLWLIKQNSSINQAPRGGFFGALSILPQHIFSQCVLYPQFWNNKNIHSEISLQNMRNWLVMIWYGSSYI